MHVRSRGFSPWLACSKAGTSQQNSMVEKSAHFTAAKKQCTEEVHQRERHPPKARPQWPISFSGTLPPNSTFSYDNQRINPVRSIAPKWSSLQESLKPDKLVNKINRLKSNPWQLTPTHILNQKLSPNKNTDKAIILLTIHQKRNNSFHKVSTVPVLLKSPTPKPKSKLPNPTIQ